MCVYVYVSVSRGMEFNAQNLTPPGAAHATYCNWALSATGLRGTEFLLKKPTLPGWMKPYLSFRPFCF